MKVITGQLKHQILIIDAKLNTTLNEANKKRITKSLVKDLLLSLKMKQLGPLMIYPAIDIKFPGWSFLQPITTSHISGHYFYSNKNSFEPNMRLDIYSCKNFSPKIAIKIINKHLGLNKWFGTLIFRELKEDRKIKNLLGFGESYSET